MSRERLVPALIVASALGVGLLVLQRWVAETKTAAIILVAIWFAIVGVAALVATSRRPERAAARARHLRCDPRSATVAIGYFTGFRDIEGERGRRRWPAERAPDTDARLGARRELRREPRRSRTSPRSPPDRSSSPRASSRARTDTPARASPRSFARAERLALADVHRVRRRSRRPGGVWLTQDETQPGRPDRARRAQGQRRRPGSTSCRTTRTFASTTRSSSTAPHSRSGSQSRR